MLPASRRELLKPPAPGEATTEELVLVSELTFLAHLVNPCQVALEGALLPRVRSLPSRQHLHPDQQRAEELAIELQRATALVREIREFAVRASSVAPRPSNRSSCCRSFG